jgi:hypothetical protein
LASLLLLYVFGPLFAIIENEEIYLDIYVFHQVVLCQFIDSSERVLDFLARSILNNEGDRQ